MGGRRSYSIGEVIGESQRAIAKRNALANSLKEKDVGGITLGTVNLIPEHRNLAKIFIYSKSLLSDIKDKYPQKKLRVVKEISRKVRVDWSNKKDREKLKSNRVIDIAVVDVVSKVLKERIK